MTREEYEAYLEKKNKRNSDGVLTSRAEYDSYLKQKTLSDAYSKIKNRLGSIDSTYSKIYNDYSSRYEGYNGGYRDDSEFFYNNADYANKSISKDITDVNQILERYKDYLDADYYNSVKSYLDGSLSSSGSILNFAKNEKDYFSQFADEDQYNSFYESYKKNQDIISNEDFNKYSKMGAEIKNPSYKDSKGVSILGKRYGAEDVGNIVTYSRDNADYIKLDSYPVGDARYSLMTDDEVSIYNYYLAKENEGLVEKGTAGSYLKGLEQDLNQRSASDEYERIFKDNEALKYAFGVYAGIDQFASGVKNLFNTTDDQIATSTAQIESQLIRESLDGAGKKILGSSIGQIAYDTITTTSNMLASQIVSGFTAGLAQTLGAGTLAAANIGSIAGNVTLGASASGNTYAELLAEGMSKDQARAISLVKGAWEGASEYYLGNIEGLAGNKIAERLANNSLANSFKAAFNGSLYAIYDFFVDASVEGLEEVVQDIGESIIDGVMQGKWEFSNIEEQLYNFTLGALSAAVLNGKSRVMGTASNIVNAKDIKKNGNAASLANAVKNNYDAKSVAYKIASKVDENSSVLKIANLIREVNGSIMDVTRQDIQNALEKKGISEKDAKSISEWLAIAVDGGELSKAQINALESNQAISDVMREVIFDGSSTVNMRLKEILGAMGAEGQFGVDYSQLEKDQSAKSIQDRFNNRSSYANAVSSTIERAVSPNRYSSTSLNQDDVNKAVKSKASAAGTDILKAQNAAQSKVSDSGSTTQSSTGNLVKIQKIDSIENGTMKVQLDNGSVVDINDINYSSTDEGMVYESVLSMGYSADTANAIVSGYNALNGVSAHDYILGINEGINYGKIGYPLNKVSSNGYFADLTDMQKKFAYDLGRNEAKLSTESAQSAIDRNKGTGTRKGKVHLDSAYSSMSERQKASISAIGRVVSDITHNDVYVFESTEKDGRRVFAKDVAGHKAGESAPNGFYDQSTGTIYIDLYAGNSGDGTMLWTAGHELTHFIRQWSPAKFKVLADFLMQEYGSKGIDINTLIQAQISKAENAGRTLSFDAAYEEVVADAMQTMFTDTNLSEKLAKLKVKDQSLFEKIAEFFKDLYERLKNAYKGLEPDSQEALFVREMTDSIEKLSDLFSDALYDAGEAFTSADIKSDADGNILFSIRPQYKVGSKNYLEFIDSLDENARKTYDALFAIHNYGARNTIKMKSGDKVHEYDLAVRFMTAGDWNEACATNPKFKSIAKGLVSLLDEQTRISAKYNLDGTIDIGKQESRLKLKRSFIQRVIDSMPHEQVSSKYEIYGKEYSLSNKKTIDSVGGESYRRALLEVNRKLFEEGKLRTAKPSTLAKDTWGALGFLRDNQKTFASGDFSTLCPQMMFNDGCWYCYRRAAMTTNVDNANVGVNVWYTGELLKLSPSLISQLNKTGGLRIQSFGDWFDFYNSQLADVIADASMVKDLDGNPLQVKIVTKEPSMIDAIANLKKQGLGENVYFNLSVDFTIEEYGEINNTGSDDVAPMNPSRPSTQGKIKAGDTENYFWKRALSVDEAKAYRDKYDWVKIRTVAINTDEFIYGLQNPYIDVVTGYHGKRNAGQNINRISTLTGDVNPIVEPIGDKGLPMFERNADGTWNKTFEGKSKYQIELGNRIEELGLQLEYSAKVCCVTGECLSCQALCGTDVTGSNTLELALKNFNNREFKSREVWGVDENALLELKNEKLSGRVYKADDMSEFDAPKEDKEYFLKGVNQLINLQMTNGKGDIVPKTIVDTFRRDLIYNGGVTFVGKKFNSIEELGVACNVFRNPMFETVRFFFLDDDNRVVYNTGFSSEIPNCSNISKTNDYQKDLNHLFRSAVKKGASSMYLMHNHPSGNPNASRADINTTKVLYGIAERAGLDFNGHVIIDHNKFQTLKADQSVVDGDIKLKGSLYEYGYSKDNILNPLPKISDDNDLASYGAYLQNSGTIVVAYANAELAVTGIQEIPLELLTDYKEAKKMLHDEALKFGSDTVFALVDNSLDGASREVVDLMYRYRLLWDVFNVDTKEDYIKSRREIGYGSGLYMNTKHTTKQITDTGKYRFSDRDSKGNALSESQQEYFKDSKVRDENGDLLVMYHGTKAEFTEFKREFIGSTGAFEGAGFNFTPSRERASSYSNGTVMSGYLNVSNPLSSEKKTFTVNSLAKLIANIDPTGDNIIANYAKETRDYGKASFVKREALTTARAVMDFAKNDVDVYSEISAASGGDTNIISEFEKIGYDGLIHYDKNGKIKTVISFNSNQFKNIDNLNPTSNPDIRYSDRDSSGNKLTKEQQKFFKDSKIRDKNGNLLVMYHGTSNKFNTFDMNRKVVNGRVYGDGAYFTSNRDYAKSWGSENIIRVYLNITNPFVIDEDSVPKGLMDAFREQEYAIYDKLSQQKEWWGNKYTKEGFFDYITNGKKRSNIFYSLENKTEVLKSLGYDGVLVTGEVVAFYPEQIKRTNNYNPTSNEDIRYQSRGYLRDVNDEKYIELAKNPEANKAELQKMVDEAFSEYAKNNSFSIEEVSKLFAEKAISAFKDEDFDAYGIRFDKRMLVPGEIFPHSRELFQDPMYDDDGELLYPEVGGYYDAGELDGTSTLQIPDYFVYMGKVKEIEKTINEYLKSKMYKGRYVYLVAGDGRGAGNDINEQLIDNAKVISVMTIVDDDSKAKKFTNKSADPVTYDDAGNIIPLSERFNAENEDIRYSERDQENPSLKTLNGSKIQRSKYGVGKQMGSQIYVHKNYAEEIVPTDVWEKAQSLVPNNFSYNCIMYDTKNPDVVRFDEAPDFDWAREPKPGKMLKVDTSTGGVSPAKGNGNMIWHHKWQWVRNDYEGFDVQESYNWSKQWLEKITNPSGSLKVWNQLLTENGLHVDSADNTKYSERVEQKISSAGTSLAQVPALFNNSKVQFGKTNIDIGGGRYDLATEALAKRGTANYIFDPFNRDAQTNRKALNVVMNGGADTATCANVLNVIAEKDARANVILEMAKAIKENGKAYFMVYEGSGKGIGKETSKGWQNNLKTEAYVDEIKEYFDSVTRNGKLITAQNPKDNLPKAYWELTAGGEVVRYSDRDLGYHAGDLGKSTVDDYYNQGYGRGTGHFGFGTYFVGNEDKINSSVYGKRPHETVDFSKYNLYKPSTEQSAYNLHDALRVVDGYIMQLPKSKAYDILESAYEERIKKERIVKEAAGYTQVNDYTSEEETERNKRIVDEYLSEVPDYIREDLRMKAQQSYDEAQRRVDRSVLEAEIRSKYKWVISRNSFFKGMYSSADDYVAKNIENDLEYAQENAKLSVEDWYYILSEDVIKKCMENAYEIGSKVARLSSNLLSALEYRFNKSKIEAALQETYDTIIKYAKGKRGLDSAATVFMKTLGYEGVDVRHLKGLDNTTYGSVIYDLKGEDLARKKEIGTARYSDRDSNTIKTLEKVNKHLENENAKLKSDYERVKELLKLQGKLTGGRILSESSLNTASKKLMSSIVAKGDVTELSSLLKTAYTDILNADTVVWDDVSRDINKAVDWLMDNIMQKKPERNYEGQMAYNYFRKLNVRLTETQKAEARNLYESYGAYRNSMLKYTNISDNAKQDLDGIWDELCEMFPDCFSPDVKEGDMVSAFASGIEAATSKYSDAFYAGVNYFNRQEIFDQVYDMYWKVSTIHTVADAKQKQINRLKAKHSESMAEMRNSRNEAIADLKKRQAEYVSKLRAEYKDRQEKKISDIKEQYKEREERKKKTVLRNKVKAYVEDFRQRLMNPTDAHYVPAQLATSIIEVFDAIDVTGADQNTRVAQKYRSAKQVLASLMVAYQSLKDESYEFSSEFSEDFANRILELHNAVGDTPVRNMDYDQLADVYEILHDISAMIKDATKQIGTSEAISNYQAGKELISQMQDINDLDIKSNAFDELLRTWMTNPLRAINEMTGFNQDARLNKVFKDLNEGRRKMETFRMNATKTFDEFRRDKYGQKWFADAVEKPVDFGLTDIDGNPLAMSKMQAMQIILTYERETANLGRRHLQGGVLIPNIELQSKGKYKDAFDKGQKTGAISPAFIAKLYEKMSDTDKAYMDKARKFFRETARDAVNETTLVTRHRLVATENNYIPYEVNKDYVRRESEALKFDATLEGMGMLKSVKNYAPQMLVIRGLNAVLSKHIDSVGKYYGLSIPVRNYNKIINMMLTADEGGESVRASIRNAWGDSGLKLVESAVDELQQNGMEKSNKLISTIKSGFVTSTLAANVSVWMKQAASYPTAGSVLSSDALIKGLSDYLKVKDHNAVYEEIDNHTAQHWLRRKGMSMQELGDMNQSQGWQNKLNEKLGKASPLVWIQAMDVATTEALWFAAKAEVDATGIDKNSASYWKRVTELYDKTIEETQPMYDSLHRAAVTKDNELKNIIMFQTQPLQNSGILRVATLEYKLNKKMYGKDSANAKESAKRLKMAVASQAASHALFTAMTALSAAIMHKVNPYRDDDDEITLSSASLEMLKQFAENYFGAILPVIGNLAISLSEKLFGSGYDVFSDAVVDKLNSTIDAFTRLKNPTFDRFVNAFSEVASYFGVPAKNAYNILKGFVLHAKDIINGEPLSFESDTDRTLSQEVSRMFKAYNNGDNEKVKKIMNDYIASYVTGDKTEKDAKSNIRTAVTRKFKSQYVDAYKKNDTDTMLKIRKFMNSLGIYPNVVETTQDWIKQSKNK